MWSWWDSLESVAKFDSVMSMLRIMGVILAAVGTGVGWWSTGRLNHLKAQRDAAEKAELRQQLAVMPLISQ